MRLRSSTLPFTVGCSIVSEIFSHKRWANVCLARLCLPIYIYIIAVQANLVMKIRYFTLFYIADFETVLINRRVLFGEQRLLIYLKNCHVLNHSIVMNGDGRLTVLTNNKPVVDRLKEANGLTFDVEEIPFCLDVPRGMGFYSAHHKIDAYRYLATLDDTYSFLLDNDVVCLGKMPDYVPELIARDAAIYYSYPICRVENHDVKVMQHIAGEGKIVTGLWVGGEFLAGSASFFADLWATVMSFADRYFEMRDSVFHQGDEMLASIAIEELMLGGRHLLVDGGPIGIVYRYLSVYEHKPIDYYSSWFAHLICDKAFLADIDVKSINSNDDFLKVYKKYCKREVALRKMYKKTKALLRR